MATAFINHPLRFHYTRLPCGHAFYSSYWTHGNTAAEVAVMAVRDWVAAQFGAEGDRWWTKAHVENAFICWVDFILREQADAALFRLFHDVADLPSSGVP